MTHNETTLRRYEYDVVNWSNYAKVNIGSCIINLPSGTKLQCGTSQQARTLADLINMLVTVEETPAP